MLRPFVSPRVDIQETSTLACCACGLASALSSFFCSRSTMPLTRSSSAAPKSFAGSCISQAVSVCGSSRIAWKRKRSIGPCAVLAFRPVRAVFSIVRCGRNSSTRRWRVSDRTPPFADNRHGRAREACARTYGPIAPPRRRDARQARARHRASIMKNAPPCPRYSGVALQGSASRAALCACVPMLASAARPSSASELPNRKSARMPT